MTADGTTSATARPKAARRELQRTSAIEPNLSRAQSPVRREAAMPVANSANPSAAVPASSMKRSASMIADQSIIEPSVISARKHRKPRPIVARVGHPKPEPDRPLSTWAGK